MTIVWDDDGDGTVFDHNGNSIGNIDPSAEWSYPNDVQTILTSTWKVEANLGNSPVMSVYAGELLVRKIDEDIARTSEGASVP